MIEANDINTLYRRALTNLVGQFAQGATASPRGMRTAEIVGATLKLNDARRCLLTWPERKLNYHFAVAEWWWILTGREDVTSIAPYCSEIAKFSDDGQKFFGAYGPPWTDQVGYVIQKLREDQDSRQAVLTIWRPKPPATKDVPCTVAMQYLARGGSLHGIVTMRSSDCWLGLPYDLFNFSRLLAVVAGELGLDVGSLQLNAGSFHLYERNLPASKALLDTYFAHVAGSHPGIAPALGDLPGLPPASLLRQSMREPMAVTQGSDAPFLPYIQVLTHRFTGVGVPHMPWSGLLK